MNLRDVTGPQQGSRIAVMRAESIGLGLSVNLSWYQSFLPTGILRNCHNSPSAGHKGTKSMPGGILLVMWTHIAHSKNKLMHVTRNQ